MSFVQKSGYLPARSVGIGIFKKELEIFSHRRLIVLGNERVVSFIPLDRLTEKALRVHRISTDYAPFDQRWRQHRFDRTDFIFLLTDLALGQHIACCHLIKGTQVHGRLMRRLMSIGSPQRFAIECDMAALNASLLCQQT